MILLKLICILESPSLGSDRASAHLWVALEFAGESMLGIFNTIHQPNVTDSADAAEADQQGLLCVLLVQLMVPVVCQNREGRHRG